MPWWYLCLKYCLPNKKLSYNTTTRVTCHMLSIQASNWFRKGKYWYSWVKVIPVMTPIDTDLSINVVNMRSDLDEIYVQTPPLGLTIGIPQPNRPILTYWPLKHVVSSLELYFLTHFIHWKLSTCSEIGLSECQIDVYSALVKVMPWCRQATSHYMD